MHSQCEHRNLSIYPKSFAHMLGRCWSAQMKATSLSFPDSDKQLQQLLVKHSKKLAGAAYSWLKQLLQIDLSLNSSNKHFWGMHMNGSRENIGYVVFK